MRRYRVQPQPQDLLRLQQNRTGQKPHQQICETAAAEYQLVHVLQVSARVLLHNLRVYRLRETAVERRHRSVHLIGDTPGRIHRRAEEHVQQHVHTLGRNHGGHTAEQRPSRVGKHLLEHISLNNDLSHFRRKRHSSKCLMQYMR